MTGEVDMKPNLIALTALVGVVLPAVARAGDGPLPLPVAGATGPVGLAIAAGGYLAYRLYKSRR